MVIEEEFNLADKMPERTANLKKLLDEWRKEIEALIPEVTRVISF